MREEDCYYVDKTGIAIDLVTQSSHYFLSRPRRFGKSYFAAPGLDISLEDPTNVGRIDMSVRVNQHIYQFEFKVVELTPAGTALQQIKDKGYADKFRASGQPIHLNGVEFSKASRNVVGFEVETLLPKLS